MSAAVALHDGPDDATRTTWTAGTPAGGARRAGRSTPRGLERAVLSSDERTFDPAAESAAAGGATLPADTVRMRALADDDARQAAIERRIGSIVAGRYRIRRVLGRGGMGVVYAAEHLVLARPVAVKFVADGFGAQSETVRRLLAEARAASSIGHENIVDVFDFGQDEAGAPYLVMEHLEGRDLATALRAAGRFPLTRALDVTLQILRGLAAAHRKGIVHRDLKPENVFLVESEARRGLVKLLDFGIARVGAGTDERTTRNATPIGTPEYMAPELVLEQGSDQRADLYALGCILYEMLTGSTPFSGTSVLAVLRAQVADGPQPPSQRAPGAAIPPSVERVIMRTLAKDRRARPESADELAAALGEASGTVGARPRAAAPSRPTQTGMPSMTRELRPVAPRTPTQRAPFAPPTPPRTPAVIAPPGPTVPPQTGSRAAIARVTPPGLRTSLPLGSWQPAALAPTDSAMQALAAGPSRPQPTVPAVRDTPPLLPALPEEASPATSARLHPETVQRLLSEAERYDMQGDLERAYGLLGRVVADRGVHGWELLERAALVERVYRRVCGGLGRVVAAGRTAARDSRESFLQSRADGSLTLGDLVDVSGMKRTEALRLLARMLRDGALVAHWPTSPSASRRG